jgi:uncharacterized protein (TIGR02611 family)
MIERVKESWWHFKGSEPGRRFQDGYRHRRRVSSGRFGLGTVLYIVGGVAIMTVGIVAVPGPDPGWLIFFLGFGLIAGEFLPFARFMDWAEVRLRRLARWAIGRWTRSSPAARTSIVLAILICAALLGYASYRLVFGS